MKAVRIHAYGDRSVLQFEDAPKPAIAPDEALVRVVAAAVNPIDWKIRQGHLKTMVPYVFPLTLGWDFSGVIEALGSEVSGLAVGDAVFSRPDIRRDGSYAEYVAVRAVEIARKPKTISHIEAASIPLVGITAWETIVSVGNLVAGQKALIHAASGGVGSLAVQIAKSRGAHVVATTSSANIELVRSLGADQVIDYRNQRFTDKVKDVDVVVDTVGGDVQASSWSVLRRGGILVSTVSVPSIERAAALGVRSAFVLISPNAAVLDQLAGLVDAGKLRPLIGGEFALRNVADAHALSESGRTVGKIVLYVGQP
ncbi:MAG: NADP-dependent oxidoreductase [Roseiarcus sp.]|jgi:NADPH:quinone reductase-like Zn-dependent oxidoreductase|uniref:NADP-dependent oxidoreductase n=1 Tax=Roseiarcus sp. TaxID=1969460 RepID=UPI003C176153